MAFLGRPKTGASSAISMDTYGKSMKRTYVVRKTEAGWEMIVWEDDEEFARGVAGDTEEDYAFLVAQANSICGIDEM